MRRAPAAAFFALLLPVSAALNVWTAVRLDRPVHFLLAGACAVGAVVAAAVWRQSR